MLECLDTSSVWMVVFSTAPMPPEATGWLAASFPQAMLVNAYGLTEAGDAACLLLPGEAEQHPGSVGKPIEGAGVRVVDDHGERPWGANQVGELLIRIGGGRRFYFGEPESSAETWQDSWAHTGDLGYLDDDGFVYVVDRKKDMIIRGGYNIVSIEVENALYEHPAIVEAAVLGVPHQILGQDVLAVVRLAEGESLDLAALHMFLADRLADQQPPEPNGGRPGPTAAHLARQGRQARPACRAGPQLPRGHALLVPGAFLRGGRCHYLTGIIRGASSSSRQLSSCLAPPVSWSSDTCLQNILVFDLGTPQ